MIGVLLAGGLGTRVGTLTRGGNKHLLDCGGVPILAHGLRQFAEAKLEEVWIVTGPGEEPTFRRALADCPFPLPSRLSFVVQPQPDGVCGALGSTAGFLPADNPLVLLLGDNLFEQPLSSLFASWTEPFRRARIHIHSLDDQEDPREFGIAILDGDRLDRIVEKPARPRSRLAVTGLVFLPPGSAERARRIPPSKRGEKELSTLLESFLREGALEYGLLEGWWVDTGTPSGLERARRLMEGERPAEPPPFSKRASQEPRP